MANLPPEVQLQGLTVQKRSSAILQFLMLYSESGKFDPLFITNYALINVLDELSRTPGVGEAHLFGRLNYSMRIWFDVARLKSLGLAPSDVIRAVQAQNVAAPVGRIGARPVPEDQQFQWNVQTQGRLTSTEEFGAIVVRANPDGSALHVRDVARVELGAQTEDTYTRLNGEPGVAIAIYQTPGANAIQTAAAVNATLDRVRARFPQGLQTRVIFDHTDFVNETIREVVKTLMEAFALVALVVFVFLGNWRATIIPIVAVPVSLIGSFAVLLTLGYSMNTVSLLAMVLAIGIVVDDAIVVVENVERVMREEPDLSPADATTKAMAQVTAPIIAITLVLLSVFVPIAFISGISGELFRQFAVTISAAMLISAINAPDPLAGALRRVSPSFRCTQGHHGADQPGDRYARDGYAALVRRMVRLSILSIVVVAAFAFAAFGLMRLTPTGFLPEEDQGGFFINVQLPDGASVNRTSEAVRQVEQFLKSMPQVQDTISIIGFSLLDQYSASNNAFMVVKLRPFADRTEASDSAQALIARVLGDSQHIRTATVFPFNLPPVIGFSTTGGFEYQLENLAGADAATLAGVVRGLVAAANQDPRLANVFSTYGASAPSIYLDIDRGKAQALGLGISDIFITLQATLGGYFINNFNLFGRTWQVNLQAEAGHRRDISALWSMFIRNAQGTMVPLQSIASVRIITGPQVISRYNNYTSATINGSPAPGAASGTALAAMSEISAKTLPPAIRSNGRACLSRSKGRPVRRESSSALPCSSPSSSSSACTRAGSSPFPS